MTIKKNKPVSTRAVDRKARLLEYTMANGSKQYQVQRLVTCVMDGEKWTDTSFTRTDSLMQATKDLNLCLGRVVVACKVVA